MAELTYSFIHSLHIIKHVYLCLFVCLFGGNVERPYLSLGHNQGEDGVRSGALVIHSCSCCGSLLVAQLKPTLKKETMN